MPYIAFQSKGFSPANLALVTTANEICIEYANQGYQLTLRQLYYQFVSRDILPNKVQSYDKLGRLVSEGRLAGLIDWAHLTDRGRNIKGNHYDHVADPSAESLIRKLSEQYALDLWSTQPRRIEVWVEKEALVDVIYQASSAWRVPAFACKGYVSSSEMYQAAIRLHRSTTAKQRPLIIHLGDHDPSGIDMTRDIEDRLAMFLGRRPEVRRIALNWDQIEEFSPPPNPAKESDGRYADYVERFDTLSSWELDALEPSVMAALVTTEITKELDAEAFEARRDEEFQGERVFETIADNWTEISEQYLEAE